MMISETQAHTDAYKTITVHAKVKTVLRLLQGENVEALADELGVAPDRVLRWKERFMEGGRAGLLARRTDKIARAQKQRRNLVQWTALLLGLAAAIWLITWVANTHPRA